MKLRTPWIVGLPFAAAAVYGLWLDIVLGLILVGVLGSLLAGTISASREKLRIHAVSFGVMFGLSGVASYRVTSSSYPVASAVLLVLGLLTGVVWTLRTLRLRV